MTRALSTRLLSQRADGNDCVPIRTGLTLSGGRDRAGVADAFEQLDLAGADPRPGLENDADPHPRHAAPAVKPALALGVHAFSSRLSSSRKCQSVPSTIIFCGLDLINPASRMRSA